MTGALAAEAGLAAWGLAAVLLLIGGLAYAAKHVPALRARAGVPGPTTLRGTLVLDRTRKLHLVELESGRGGGCHALVLTGGGADCVIALPHPP